MGTQGAHAFSAGLAWMDQRRARRSEFGNPCARRGKARASRDDSARIPTLVGRRCRARSHARCRVGRQCIGKALARSGGPRAQAAIRARRDALFGFSAIRATQQPFVLRRPRPQFWATRDGRARLVPAVGVVAGGRSGRTSPGELVGTLGQVDEDRRRGDQRRLEPCERRARHLRAPGRHAS